jgi:hypothetical protein
VVFETRVDLTAVRGFFWSICQSANRLNAIAAVLAPTRQISTPAKILPSGQPPAARNIAANPNGIANTVWENLMNSPHRRIENFTPFTLPHRPWLA